MNGCYPNLLPIVPTCLLLEQTSVSLPLNFSQFCSIYDKLVRFGQTYFHHFVQNLFAKCCTHLYCFPEYLSSFQNSLERSMTTLDLIGSICIGHNETAPRPSDKDSDVMGLVLTIASISVSSVWIHFPLKMLY